MSDTNLDLLCDWQSDAAPFCENYAKLYFAAKHFADCRLQNTLGSNWGL